jgi:hypothetical protein
MGSSTLLPPPVSTSPIALAGRRPNRATFYPASATAWRETPARPSVRDCREAAPHGCDH